MREIAPRNCIARRSESQVESEEKRYEGVVASAVMRAMFPKDVARRAFLRSLGASTALTAGVAILPAQDCDRLVRRHRPGREEGSQGRLHSDHLRHPDHHGEAHGLLREARAQRRGHQDGGLGGDPRQDHHKEYDASPHAVANADRHHPGCRLDAIPYTAPAIENINGQAITLSIKHKDKRDPKDWKGFKFAVPFDYSMHNICCAIISPSMASTRTRMCRSAPCRRRKWSPICAPTISTASSVPIRLNQRAVFDGVGFIHMLSKEIWDGHPCCAFAASKEFVDGSPNTYAALLKAIIDATAFAHKPENRKQIAEATRAGELHQSAGHSARTDPHRHLRDGLGNVKTDANRVDSRSVPVAILRGLDHDPDEALGSGQGRYRLQQNRQRSLPRYRYLKADGRGRPCRRPKSPSKSFVVMGKTFDPAEPEDYIKGFKIKKAV